MFIFVTKMISDTVSKRNDAGTVTLEVEATLPTSPFNYGDNTSYAWANSVATSILRNRAMRYQLAEFHLAPGQGRSLPKFGIPGHRQKGVSQKCKRDVSIPSYPLAYLILV